MMAISNSWTLAGVDNPPAPRRKTGRAGCRNRWRALFLAGVLAVLAFSAQANGQASTTNSVAARAERTYYEALAHFNKNTNNLEAAWHLGRACFDWADFTPKDSQRAEVAQKGLAACHRAIELNSKSAAGFYYLGLNLGQLARTKSLGALRLIVEIEDVWKTAIQMDPTFDYAGPHRSLGLLYRDAPSWPTSIGSRGKARVHLKKAVELSPDYPDNWLSLLESYLEWNERKSVLPHLNTVEKCLQEARKKLTGEAWTSSWQDWDLRWAKIKSKTAKSPATLESPRNQK